MMLVKDIFEGTGRKSIKRGLLAISAAVGAVLAGGLTARADITGFTGFSPINTEGASTGDGNIGYQSSNTVFELTDGQNGEGTSGWDPTTQNITSGFTATYTYQTVPEYPKSYMYGSLQADGVALAFQSPLTGSTSALGGGGGSLGYAGITTNSAAIGYETFGGYYTYPGGSEFLANSSQGNVTTLGGGDDLSTGDTFQVRVSYYGSTLTQTTIDMTTGTAASQISYSNVNLSAVLGTSSAIVGFTGATGGYNSTQKVGNFSLVAGLSYSPIAVTGFNQQGVISVANGTAGVTATMDGGTGLGGDTWFEKGYSTNLPNAGLPASGSTFTSQADSSHVFTLQPYSGNDIVLLNSTSTSGTLTFSSPAAYKALSFLTSTGSGPGVFTATIDYSDGAPASTAQFVESPDWFNNQPVAWSAGGRATLADSPSQSENDGTNPNLYQEDLTLTDTTDPISQIVLNYSSGGNIFIFGVSGAATSNSNILVYTGDQVPGAFNTSSINFNNGTNTNFSNGDMVVFDDTSANTAKNRTIIVASGITPGGLTFNNTTATLPYTFSGAGIGGNGGITVNGDGTVIFDNPNTFSGPTVVNAGAVVVGTGGDLASNTITAYTGATLNVSGGALTSTSLTLNLLGGAALYSGTSLSIANFNGSGPFTSTNATGTSLTLTGSGTYTGNASLGTGAVTVNANGSTVALTGTNTYSGGTVLQAGTLMIGNGSLGSGTLNLSGGVIGAASASVNLTNQVVGGALIATSGNNLLELSNSANSFAGPIVVQSGTLQVDSPTVIGSTTTIDVASGASFLVNDTSGNAGLGTTMTISGTGVTATGPSGGSGGTGALRGADTVANDVWAGNINVSGPSYISAGANGGLYLTGSITGNGPVVFTESPNTNGGTIIVLAPSGTNANTYTGETQILPGPTASTQGDVVQLGANNAISTSSGLNFLPGPVQDAQVDLNGFNQQLTYLTSTAPAQSGFSLTSSSGPSTLTITSGVDSGTPGMFVLPINGNVSLVMNDPTGTGNQILAGASTYSGTTTIKGGTLSAANSTALSTGQVNLSGGTLALVGVGSLGNSSLNQFVINQGSGPGGNSFASASGGTLTLTTNGINGVANSAFYPLKVPVSDAAGFTAHFVYNITAGYADGMAFVLQNDPRGASAVSAGAGGSLGIAGTNAITNSAAVEFEIYPFNNPPGSGTEFQTDGQVPGTAGNPVTNYINTSPVNIALENIGGNYYFDFQPIDVTLTYNGIAQTLTETLYSETEQQTFSTTYTGVDYSSILGGTAGGNTTAYIGFTAATGGVSSTQQIYDFSYTPGVATAPQSISNNIVATAGTSSSIQLGVQPGAFDTGATVGSITVQTGATLALTNSTNGSRGVLVTPSISIASAHGSFTGQLDVGYNDLDIQASGGMTLAQVTAMVASGYNNGKWNGEGIASSAAAADTTHLTALGVILNDNGSGTPLYGAGGTFPTFDGSALPGDDDILVKYTYYGDATLQGSVTATDYSRIDNGYLNHLTGWYNGDFNYDGVVNGSDYTLIDNAYNMQGASNPLAEDASSTAQVAAAVPPVPEPATLGLMAVGAVGLLGKRRRRN